MKKIMISLLLAFMLVLTACSSTTGNSQAESESTAIHQESSSAQLAQVQSASGQEGAAGDAESESTEASGDIQADPAKGAITQIDKIEEEAQPTDLSLEDFIGRYVTFEGTTYNSRPETLVDILADEIRIGWPQSEYIPYEIVDATISDQVLIAQVNEIGMNGETVSQDTFEIALDLSDSGKTITINGTTFYGISQEDYDTLIQRSYSF